MSVKNIRGTTDTLVFLKQQSSDTVHRDMEDGWWSTDEPHFHGYVPGETGFPVATSVCPFSESTSTVAQLSEGTA